MPICAVQTVWLSARSTKQPLEAVVDMAGACSALMAGHPSCWIEHSQG